jgi:hypothetical protein
VETTNKVIEQAPIFDESIKPANVAFEPSKTQEKEPTIKVTNVHETEFLEGAEDLT